MEFQQDSLGFLLADASRLYRRAFQRRLEGSSITLAQARALVHVARHEGVRQVDLADLLELQPMTLARLIDQLAAAGLVERRADPADRRAYRVFLRPAAAAQLAAQQFDAADNMTDRQGALMVLCGLDTPLRAEKLAQFHARFAGKSDSCHGVHPGRALPGPSGSAPVHGA